MMEYLINNQNIPNDIKTINNTFKQLNFKFYLVGGAVRDMFLNILPLDYDFVTDALPDDIIEILKSLNCKICYKGQRFGVISGSFNKYKIEICTFRKDVTDERLPEVQLGVDIADDAYRRDITYNALYYDIDKEIVYDYVGGVDDMNNKITKIIGDPYLRIKQDKLRILRVVRCACKYKHTMDPLTIEAIKNSDLKGISKERIYEEIIRAFKNTNYDEYLTYLRDFNIFKNIFLNMNVTYDKKLNSNFIEIYLAYILRNNSNIESKLLNLGFDKKISGIIKLLKNLINFNSKKLQKCYTLKKRFIKDDSILKEWINIMDLGNNQKKFIDYKPIINKEMVDIIIKEGNKYKTISKKINEIETNYFISLLDK